jgi:hypothetical protein
VALEGEVLEEVDLEVPSGPRVGIIVDTVMDLGTMEVGIMVTEEARVLEYSL